MELLLLVFVRRLICSNIFPDSANKNEPRVRTSFLSFYLLLLLLKATFSCYCSSLFDSTRYNSMQRLIANNRPDTWPWTVQTAGVYSSSRRKLICKVLYSFRGSARQVGQQHSWHRQLISASSCAIWRRLKAPRHTMFALWSKCVFFHAAQLRNYRFRMSVVMTGFFQRMNV